MTTTTTDLVFTYGTLMRDQGNHRLLADATFVAEAAIEGFAMHCNGHFPMIVAADEPRLVHGEIFRVTADELADLDRLEGVEWGMYRRELVSTLDGALVWVYMWNRPIRGERPVPGGAWAPRRVHPEAPHVVVTLGDGSKRQGTALDVVARMAAEGRARGGHDERTLAGFVAWSTSTIAGLTGIPTPAPAGDTRDELALAYLETAARAGLVTIRKPRRRASRRA